MVVQSQQKQNGEVRWPFIASILFHTTIVILIVLFGHMVTAKKPETPKIIPIELLRVDAPLAEVTETLVEDEPVEEVIPQAEPESEPVEETVESAPQSTNEAPPPLPESAPALPEPDIKPAPEPEEDTETEEVVSFAPQMTPRPVARPVIDLEEPETEKEEESLKAEDEKPDFASVLKNLADNKKASSGDTPQTRQSPMLTQPPPVGQALTQSELAALRRQLAQCWNVLPGARDADDIVVALSLTMNPDRTIQRAVVKDQARLSDPFFKAAADSALRAVRNPRCSPLELPAFKYDQWKEMTIRFDPKDMF